MTMTQLVAQALLTGMDPPAMVGVDIELAGEATPADGQRLNWT